MDFNIPIQQVTNVNVIGRGLVVVPGTSRPVTSQGFPIGFIFSEEPNGLSFSSGLDIAMPELHRPPPTSRQQSVLVTPSIASILRPCPPGTRSIGTCTPTGSEVTLVANATDPDNDQLLYTWSVTGGRLSGEGRQVTWDLTGVANGTYTATVEVNDGNQHTANGSTTVTVADCTGCVAPPTAVSDCFVSCPSEVEAGQPITFTASVSGETGGATTTYNWSVSAGTISSGQGTRPSQLIPRVSRWQSVTATVNIGGLDPSLQRNGILHDRCEAAAATTAQV